MKKLIHWALNKFGYEINNKSRKAQYLVNEKWKFLCRLDINTIIDVGANEGQFINEVIRFFPNAEIYSFEPLNDCYEKLLLNYKKNNRVHAFNLALGEEDGEIIFCRSSASPSSSILKMGSLHKKLYPHTANLVEEKVKVKRLDGVMENIKMRDNILLKIDVQGAEDKVIKGASEILKRVDIIITEVSYAALYEGQPLFKDIMTLLENHNYIYMGNLEQFSSPLTNAPIFSDAIFVSKEIHSILYNS